MKVVHVVVDMRRHIATACIAVLGFGVLAGCANPDGTNSAAPGSATSPGNLTSSVASGPSGTVPSATPTAIVNPPGPSDDPNDGVTTVHGQMTQGVEPSCKLVTDDKVEYLLLAADSVTMPPIGASVIVTGHVEHGIMTHCQQGIPFAVTTIKQIVTPQGGVTMNVN